MPEGADTLCEKVVQLPAPERSRLTIRCDNGNDRGDDNVEEKSGTPQAAQAMELALDSAKGSQGACDRKAVARGPKTPEASRIARAIAKALHTSEHDSGILVEGVRALKEVVDSSGIVEEDNEIQKENPPKPSDDTTSAALIATTSKAKEAHVDCGKPFIDLTAVAVSHVQLGSKKKARPILKMAGNDIRNIPPYKKRRRDSEGAHKEAGSRRKKRKIAFCETVKTHDGLSLVHTCECVCASVRVPACYILSHTHSHSCGCHGLGRTRYERSRCSRLEVLRRKRDSYTKRRY